MNFLKLFFSEIYIRRRSILMSIAIAFVAWIVTIVCTDRYSVFVVKGVPITANLTNTQTEQLGLDIVKIQPTCVDIYLKGPRWKIAQMTKDDLVVTPISFKNMVGEEDYEIDLKADIKQLQPDVVIEKINPCSAIFSVDTLTTKRVDVTCSLANIQAEEGFVLDLPVCQPKDLYVSGPKKFVDCLKEIQLSVSSLPKFLNFTKTFEARPKFVTNNGIELDQSLFNFNKATKFSVTCPIYMQKQIPLTFMFKNAPSCLDVSLLRYSTNPEKISLGLSRETADSLKELSMGYIDMRQLDFDTNFNFNVVVPAGCKNLSQADAVNVFFDTTDWSYKFFSIDDIRLINPHENFEVKIKSSVLEKVKIIGLKDHICDVNKADITATVDLSSVKLKPGEQNIPVNIGILNKNGVWPVGFYSCLIDCKKT